MARRTNKQLLQFNLFQFPFIKDYVPKDNTSNKNSNYFENKTR